MSSLRDAREVLDRDHWFLLLVLGATAFFDGYDRGILEVALNQIRDTYDLSQADASLWLSILFIGALPALFITRWADRVGRRRMLLISITGYTAATGLTAVAPGIEAYVACQFLSRLFLNAEWAIVWTMAAEALPAKARGFGFGVISMNQALGVGFGAILFGGFLEPAGISWRWLYVIGLPALLLVARLRRRLPESRRFLSAQAAGRLAERWHEIMRPPHRRWLVLVVTTVVLIELVSIAGIFAIDFLQEDRGLSATTASFMLVGAGLPGIPIMVVAGALSDRYGRRLVGCGFATMATFGALGFFWLPGGVPVLLPAFSVMLVGSMGAGPALSSYTAELFPTSLRSQAGSWATIGRVVGQTSSLALGGLLIQLTGGLSATVTILGVGSVVAIVMFAVLFPDTHGRELEDISGDGMAPVPTLATPVVPPI